MRILGVDPALAVTGYGIIEGARNKLRIIEAGIITTNAKQTVEQRLDKFQSA